MRDILINFKKAKQEREEREKKDSKTSETPKESTPRLTSRKSQESDEEMIDLREPSPIPDVITQIDEIMAGSEKSEKSGTSLSSKTPPRKDRATTPSPRKSSKGSRKTTPRKSPSKGQK